MNGRRYSVGVIAFGMCVASSLLAIPSGASADAGRIGYAGPARGITQTGSIIDNASQQFASRNWDGYITYVSSAGTDFNAVNATWVQPTVTCEAANAWTVFWVGLDGWWNNTVEQGGSEAYCATVGGAPTYNLWWEMFPTNSIQTGLVINAGDKITASVKYATATSVFTITVKDVTSGRSLTKHELCGTGLVCSRSSADVITEDVGRFGSGNYFPLAKYGTMRYAAAGVIDTAGNTGTISGSHWLNAAVTESSGGITYATVGPLSSLGNAFSTTWKHQ